MERQRQEESGLNGDERKDFRTSMTEADVAAISKFINYLLLGDLQDKRCESTHNLSTN